MASKADLDAANLYTSLMEETKARALSMNTLSNAPHGLPSPLGRSDDLSEHYCDSGEENEASIVGEELVISCRDAPELFQLVEEAFDEISLFVERLVVGERRTAIRFGRNDGFGSAFEDSLAQVIGVITFVGDDGLSLKAFDQGVRLCDVVALTWPEQQADGIAERVGCGVDLCAQAAAGPAQTLGICPPLAIRAPAACWWARTMVESIISHSRSASVVSASRNPSNAPRSIQR
jgi:hypothetical protein